MGFQTDAIHEGVSPDKAYGAIMTPIYQTSIFAFEEIGKTKGYEYTRSGNPTRRALEENLAKLEGGIDAIANSAGMSAIATVLFLFRSGEEILCAEDCYGGTYRILKLFNERFGLKYKFINMRDENALKKNISKNTKALWIETPSNPLLNIIDLEKVCGIAKENNLISIADNTFMTPYFQKPFKFGVDVIVHSTTKYLNGHSDVVGGAVILNNKELSEKIKFIANAIGAQQAPIESWLVLRGIKTLPQRMKEHQKNAQKIAEYLETNKKVQRVFYPGLGSHPNRDLAIKQQTGFGGIVSFEITGGIEEVNRVLTSVKIFTLAGSLGGVESLIAHPATMSHSGMDREFRLSVGINDNLIRLSVGIEDSDDLISDLDQALEKIH